jgi:gliding motility-associated-like protein
MLNINKIWLCTLLLVVSSLGHAQGVFEFVENKGQWDGPFTYKSTNGYSDVYLKPNGVTYVLKDASNRKNIDEYKHGHTRVAPALKFHAYEMNFLGANKSPQLIGSKAQKIYYNYFLGNDASKWATELHPYLTINYKNLYDGVDAKFYNDGNSLKYDLIIAPNTDVSKIIMQYKGLDKINLTKSKLVLKTSLGDNQELEPYAYQYINGDKQQVDCKYILQGDNVSFELGNNYNKDYELIIDPTLVFCTFTGSSSDNWGYTATPGANGEFYAGGIVSGTGYPFTTGAYQQVYGGGSSTAGNTYACDIAISKFDATGANAIYATYLGGSSNEEPYSIIEDNATGQLVILGRTYSTNYPTKFGCFDTTSNGGSDIIVTRLNAASTNLIGSTLIGGSSDDGVNYDPGFFTRNGLKYFYGDENRGEVIIDQFGNILIAGNTKSSNFPVTGNAFQSALNGASTQDGVYIKLNPSLTSVLYCTFLGGSSEDGAYVLHVDKTNPTNLYIAGGTTSSNFPVTAGSLHSAFQGGTTDGYVARFDNIQDTFVAATFIGTSAYDQVFGIQDDNLGNVYIMGHTMGTFPITANVYSNSGGRHFVQCLDSTLSTSIRSTRFGTSLPTTPNLSLNAFLVDSCGNVYISGWGDDGPATSATATAGTNGLVTTPGAIQGTTDGGDFYFIVFTKDLDTLAYASFYGQNGIAANGLGAEHVDGGTSRFDRTGNIYQAICANCGGSIAFPVTGGSYSTVNTSNNCNLAALKISFNLLNAVAKAGAGPSINGCPPLTVNFTNSSTSATSYSWDFGNGGTSTAATPTTTYTTAGVYTVTLQASNTAGCLLTGSSDTAQIIITVTNDTIKNNFTTTKLDSCVNYTLGVTNASTFAGGAFSGATSWLWNWGDGNTSTLQNPGSHTYSALGTYLVSLIITDTNACNSPVVLSKSITFFNNYVNGDFNLPDSVCAPYNGTFNSTTSGIITGYNWNFGDGGTSTSQNTTHAYSNTGTYTATLIVTNPLSCNGADTSKQTIFINGNIAANFNFTKGDTCDPYIINVTDLSTLNPARPNSASTTTYEWQWGDGTTSFGSTTNTHAYANAGTYTITLILRDSLSCNSPQQIQKVVSFINNNVEAEYELPDTVCRPYLHQFANTSLNAATNQWFFSDGTSSTSVNPSKDFNTVGTYTVVLYAYNPTTCNLVDSLKKKITVMESPTADFTYKPLPPLPNKPVQFINLSTGAISYAWEFGDGEGSVEFEPTHLYNKTLETEVCLTAYNNFGCPNRKCIPISPRVVNILDVPTAFSPNGDGINDVVMAKGFGVKEMVFRIFNRWGELVFETTKVDDPWNGVYKGKVQEMDAYAYTLQATFTDGNMITKKGNITLIH